MNKVKTFFLGMAMLAVLVSSCTKKDKKSEDPQPDLKKEASITIDSPTTGQQFEHGTTVTISGKIESDEQLHGYKLIIRQKSDNSEKYVENAHTHSKTIEFNETWVVDVEGHQDMELEVIGILDHDGNIITKKIDFHCHGH